MGFTSNGQKHVWLNVVAADLSQRHKSKLFPRAPVLLKVDATKDLRIIFVGCGMPTRKSGSVANVPCGQALSIKMLPTNPSGSVGYCV
jgi:hypothetical protein